MSYAYANPYTVAASTESERAAFIRRTYSHLAGSIAACALLVMLFFQTGLAEKMFSTFFVQGGMSWLLVIGAFMLVGFVADRWAQSNTSQGMQYLGLGLYIVAQAVILLPLLYLAQIYTGSSELIAQAGVITGLLVAGLTAVVFVTRKDFSFLRSTIMVGGFVAIGTIIAMSLFGGFGGGFGTLFMGAMILLASGSILYTTSNIMNHYNPQQHVAASLALFGAVGMMFWYVLQLLMVLRGNN